MEQTFNFVRTIGYGDSYFESLFRPFNLITLHAILHVAAGAVQARNDKESGYCYTVGQRTNSSRLGQVARLLFCLHVKSFCLPFSILSTFEAVCVLL